MEAAIIAARSITRARDQHVQARYMVPGHYRVASKSQRGTWYDVRATKVGSHVRVVCSCPGGEAFRDEVVGSSLCKHAACVSKRLLAHPAELAVVPSPAAPHRATYEDVFGSRARQRARIEEAW